MINYKKKNVRAKFAFFLTLALSTHCSTTAYTFPVGAFSCEKIHEADSCKITFVQFPGATRFAWLDSVLLVAEQLDINVILSDALAPSVPYPHNLTKISGATAIILEGESTKYAHETGTLYPDKNASSKHTWISEPTRTGWLIYDQWLNLHDPVHTKSTSFCAYYYLKISDNTDDNPACKLVIRRKVDSEIDIFTEKFILSNDFFSTDSFQAFRLNFTVSHETQSKYDFALFCLNTKSRISVDKIIVVDLVADSLLNGFYDPSISKIAEYFDKKSAVQNFYLWDEPIPTQFYVSSVIHDKLNRLNSKEGIQTLSHYAFVSDYLDFYYPRNVMFDYYPFWGKNCKWGGRIPKDSGLVFQERLDFMCNTVLSSVRKAIKKHPGSRLWYIPQAFGKAINLSNPLKWKSIWNDSIPFADEYWWREPTPREMYCQVWLALAYGAKGLCYWRYHSRRMNFHGKQCWVIGMTDSLGGKVKRPLWHTVHQINSELQTIGSTLVKLESDTVFKSDNIPRNNYITDISDDLIQIGTFNDDKDKYFIIVNRHCLPHDSITTRITLEMPYRIALFDYLENRKIFATEVAKNMYHFTVQLPPGRGKLFKIISI